MAGRKAVIKRNELEKNPAVHPEMRDWIKQVNATVTWVTTTSTTTTTTTGA